MYASRSLLECFKKNEEPETGTGTGGGRGEKQKSILCQNENVDHHHIHSYLYIITLYYSWYRKSILVIFYMASASLKLYSRYINAPMAWQATNETSPSSVRQIWIFFRLLFSLYFEKFHFFPTTTYSRHRAKLHTKDDYLTKRFYALSAPSPRIHSYMCFILCTCIVSTVYIRRVLRSSRAGEFTLYAF